MAVSDYVDMLIGLKAPFIKLAAIRRCLAAASRDTDNRYVIIGSVGINESRLIKVLQVNARPSRQLQTSADDDRGYTRWIDRLEYLHRDIVVCL